MPTFFTASGLRDNHTRGSVADFIRGKVQTGSRLSVVSVLLSLNAASHPIRNRLLRLTTDSPDEAHGIRPARAAWTTV